jgi:D-amino-acid dehydrogenase
MKKIIVVGAGVIGASIALELQRRGNRVVLLDRDAPGMGASYGNMASIAVTEFMPISRPTTWLKLPGWLLDAQGPIRLRPGYLPKLMPWLYRFLLAGLPGRVSRLEQAGSVLCQRVYQDLLPFMRDIGAESMLSEKGCISLYAGDAEYAADKEHIDIIRAFGFDCPDLDRAELDRLEPGLSKDISRGVLFPQNRFLSDPHRYVQRIVDCFVAGGGQLLQEEVLSLHLSGGKLAGVHTRSGIQDADDVVLCCGAFTGRLSRTAGEPIPLETERGYHTQIMQPGIALEHSLIWPAKAFMVTPTAGGIRVGGTVELAGLDAAPDYRRAKVLVGRAQSALPGLQAKETSEWMGHRPALPDTIPLISPSARHPGLFYATGHGHLGLTYSATTARLMADLVTGQQPPIDMTPYRINRFQD